MKSNVVHHVIKNEALERSYKGGLIGFLDKYGERSNGKITVLCYMGFEFDETVDDLVESGLKFLEDFEFIDAGCLRDPFAVANNIKQRVNWLKGRYANGYIYVWYNDNYQEDA